MDGNSWSLCQLNRVQLIQPIAIFSGANIPLADLPASFQALSFVLPPTRGITAARSLVNGASLADVAPLLWGELIVALIYFMLGYFLFTAFEAAAKRRGTLEVF